MAYKDFVTNKSTCTLDYGYTRTHVHTYICIQKTKMKFYQEDKRFMSRIKVVHIHIIKHPCH